MAHDLPAEQFEALVANLLDEVPEEFWPALDNLVVVVEEYPPPGEDLFGLYEGVPVTERSFLDPTALPDRISIYRVAHCEAAIDGADLAEQVRVTLFHELGHHLGLDEDRLTELGWD